MLFMSPGAQKTWIICRAPWGLLKILHLVILLETEVLHLVMALEPDGEVLDCNSR